MKTLLSLFVLAGSISLSQAQATGCVYPGGYQTSGYTAPAAVYQAPVVYQANVVYQGPVIYNAPVYYVGSDPSYDWQSDWEEQCDAVSTVVYIGGGRVAYSQMPVCNSGSTLVTIGHGFTH